MPVSCIHGCRMNVYQDLIVLGSRFCYLFELKNIRLSVVCVDNCFHGVSTRSLKRFTVSLKLVCSWGLWIGLCHHNAPFSTEARVTFPVQQHFQYDVSLLREGSQTDPNGLAARLMPLPMLHAHPIAPVARPMAHANG